jgi:hypothetical protein
VAGEVGSWRHMVGEVDPAVLATEAPCSPSTQATEAPCSPSMLAAAATSSPFMLGHRRGALATGLGRRNRPRPPCLPSQKGEVGVVHCKRRGEECGLETDAGENKLK